MKRFFNPTEIIFCPTDACNLRCPHCFVGRGAQRLLAEDAVAFIDSAVDGAALAGKKIGRKLEGIERIGFSGGEPFLAMDFLLAVIPHAVDRGLMFDQIMTNGDWWKNEADLKGHLLELRDAGYDGKIGLSWDGFHGQLSSRMVTFIECVWEIFGLGSVSIQQVLPQLDEQDEFQRSTGFYCTEMKELSEKSFLPVFTLPQTFMASDSRGWQSDVWFKDDFCTGPGNILFVHPNGTVAPCCGFANENEALLVGTIKDSFEQVMVKAFENTLVRECYEKGLLKRMKSLEKKKVVSGKTCDICTACDFICKME